MTKDNFYNFLFLVIGAAGLFIGLNWKKPTYGGGVVHKYVLIIIGSTLIIYGVLSFL